jgi:photosystem II stability/assembly factor-like uncharacterized protein
MCATRWVLTLALLLGAADPARADEKNVVDPLQGSWTMVPCFINDEELSPDPVKSGELVVQNNEYRPKLSAAQWTPEPSVTKARLRGLAVVNTKVVWASGTSGTFIRTDDGGTSWKAGHVAGALELDFRDVHAFDDRKAILLSIGEGAKSRIYRTEDGGATWALRFLDRDARIFLDALSFWDANHGIALGDPVDGSFTVLLTDDGGMSWKRSTSENMPHAKKGEGAFAASGNCLVVEGERNVWFGTGGADHARVFRSVDRGQSWNVHETPISAAQPSSGLFSLTFRDRDHGIAVGGDYKEPDKTGLAAALTSDGGRTWTLPTGKPPAGYRSAVAYVPGASQPTAVAVGPTGSDLSTDGGESWSPLGTMGFHAVGCSGLTDAGWAVGDNGLLARYRGSFAAKP